MALLNSVINWINFKRNYQIQLYREHPFDIQHETLFNLLRRARNTAWGEKFRYDKINSVADFQRAVPLQTYEDIKPWVERLRQGETDLLWPGEVKWFAKSSGTTSEKSKFIPVTKEALEDCHLRGPKDVFAIYIKNYPETKVLFGKTLTLGGSHSINNFANNSYYGDLSAILIENVPFWTDLMRIPPAEIALIEEFEEKVERIIETSLDQNVTSFAGVPSWYLVLLKRILEKTGKNNILEVWPNLEVFTHGGVNFEPYREQYQKLIPSEKMHYMETYNASEGFFAIQDDPSRRDMMLMLDYGVYYEFIPMSEFGSENPSVLTLEEVELNENYALVISTNAGLWRYIIGDTVQFVSKNPYRLKITGRTKHFINAFGEEVIVDNAENALKTACEKTGAIVSEYTAGPIFMGDNQKGAHQWVIEFEKEPADVNRFALLLDERLQQLNSDYEAKRHKSITLEMLHLEVAPKGTFYQWMKNRGKVGGQNKIPRLSNDRKYLDELLSLLKK
ncbi:GH3 auxin-responsive promoter [Mariniphaga anaerophila]|uniref:GH3 auxin-responsive promoter n=1 Tax=Mariniphaga anaerophila TaxID=1484053 RepID=A0A1M4YU77_9BACT|nr:GH3 auxin-responsive promoter family protein [Mariniphaga anaerophila]SHF09394.1 GH3 auxin-responsive promoter [Mariniphaga anaerophila]